MSNGFRVDGDMIRDRAPEIVVLTAANSWDEERMADHQLARALSEFIPVLYVDPVSSVHRSVVVNSWPTAMRRGVSMDTFHQVSRLRPIGLPKGSTSLGSRVNGAVLHRQINQAVRVLGLSVKAVLDANMLTPSAHRVDAIRKVYWAQDDFVGMAPLVGIKPEIYARNQRLVLKNVDAVVAANTVVAGELSDSRIPVELIPFGCDVDLFATTANTRPAAGIHLRAPIACLMGTINDRIDFELLEAVVDSGVSLLLVGPLSDQCAARNRFRDLLARESVQWVGRQAFRDLPSYLRHAAVGLVPYTRSRFNVGSFPLKTLEYLAAGLPVVAADLPGTRWVNDPDIHVVAGAREFATAVRCHALAAENEPARIRRTTAARPHSWHARARDFARVLRVAAASD